MIDTNRKGEREDMSNWQPWVYPGHWSMDEHNAVLAALRKAEARVRELEALYCPNYGNKCLYFNLHQDAVEKANAIERELSQKQSNIAELEARQAAPTATPETLEALSEIGLDAYYATAPDNCKRKLSEIAEACKEDTLAQTAAILRAARPRVDVGPTQRTAMQYAIEKHPDPVQYAIDICNESIRYGVETVTTAEESAAILGAEVIGPVDAAKFIQHIQAAQDATHAHSVGPFGESSSNAGQLPTAAQELSTIPPSPVPTWRDPTQAELDSSLFNAIWNCIKTWDVNVPDQYNGYMGAIGNHVTLILDAICSYIGQRGITTDAQIDALAKIIRYMWLSTNVDWLDTDEPSREQWRKTARAAYAHIGAELAARAVIDVPPGVPSVPSVEDVLQIVVAAHYGWSIDGGISVGRTDREKFRPYAAAIRDAVLAGVGECQECAAAKRAVQIERDGVNALAARIAAARAALDGES